MTAKDAIHLIQWLQGTTAKMFYLTTAEELLRYYEEQDKGLMVNDIVCVNEKTKTFIGEYIEAWEQGMAGDISLYRKAKSINTNLEEII